MKPTMYGCEIVCLPRWAEDRFVRPGLYEGGTKRCRGHPHRARTRGSATPSRSIWSRTIAAASAGTDRPSPTPVKRRRRMTEAIAQGEERSSPPAVFRMVIVRGHPL